MGDKDRLPTRADSDAVIDRMLGRATWSGDADTESVDLMKGTRWELRGLEAVVARHPEKKTPQVAERLDMLRREYRQQLKDFGLDPAGRKLLGVPHGLARRREDGRVMYRSPQDVNAAMRVLVSSGVWDAVGAKIKADLAANAELAGDLSTPHLPDDDVAGGDIHDQESDPKVRRIQ